MSDDQNQKPTGPVRRPRPPKPPKRKFTPSKLPEGLSQRDMAYMLFAKLRTPFRVEVLYRLARYPRPEGYTSAELQELLRDCLDKSDADPMSTLWWEHLLDVHEEEGQPPRFTLREKSPLLQLFRKKILSLFLQDPEEQEEK